MRILLYTASALIALMSGVAEAMNYENINFAQISSQTESDSDLYSNAETDVYADLAVDAYETKAQKEAQLTKLRTEAAKAKTAHDTLATKVTNAVNAQADASKKFKAAWVEAKKKDADFEKKEADANKLKAEKVKAEKTMKDVNAKVTKLQSDIAKMTTTPAKAKPASPAPAQAKPATPAPAQAKPATPTQSATTAPAANTPKK